MYYFATRALLIPIVIPLILSALSFVYRSCILRISFVYLLYIFCISSVYPLYMFCSCQRKDSGEMYDLTIYDVQFMYYWDLCTIWCCECHDACHA